MINPLSGAISMLTPNLRDRIKIVHGSFVADQSERSKASQSWLRKPSQSCYLCDLPCYPSQRLQLCEGSLRVSRIVSAISDLLTPKSLRKDDFRRCWKCSIIYLYISVERTILHRNIYGSLTVPLLHHRGKIARNVLVTFLAPLLVRGGVGRLAGLSVPLAPVQWGGFVAWGAIPSTQVHPSLPALYFGQGRSGTAPRGAFPSVLRCPVQQQRWVVFLQVGWCRCFVFYLWMSSGVR